MARENQFDSWEAEEKREARAYEKERARRRARAAAQKKARRRHAMRLGIMAAAALVLVIVLIAALTAIFGNPLKRTLRVEAGEPMPTARDFLKRPKSKKEVSLVTDLSGITTDHVSETEVVLMVGEREKKSKLVIQDTVAPVAEAEPLTVSAGMEVAPQELVKNVEDATDLTYEFAVEPDCRILGNKEAAILITDEGGNQIKVTTEVSVVNDTEPPVLYGVGPITTLQGETVDYAAGISVTDNVDRNVDVQVDSSAVNLNAPGIYHIAYRAIDHAGNSTQVATTLTVEAKSDDYIDPEIIYQQMDPILDEILTDEMSLSEKAAAIYQYTREHLWYVDDSHADSWTACAQMALDQKSGDCYVFAALSRALLDRAGIENLTIDRLPASDEDASDHRWLLVKTEDGWYHFDPTARRDGTAILLWTDAQLAEYSDSHGNSHRYDKSFYPATPTGEETTESAENADGADSATEGADEAGSEEGSDAAA